MNTTIPRYKRSDPFYRYKRVILPIVIIAKYGGVTTISLKSLATLSKQLNRSDVSIARYIGKNANTATIIKEDHVQYKKIMSSQEVDDIVEQYIEHFVLCSACENPETLISSKGLVCKACGNTTIIETDKQAIQTEVCAFR
jgi:translation initiation factor 5